jgi:hypothetical protein
MRSAQFLAFSLLALVSLGCSDDDATSTTGTTPPSTIDFIQMSYEVMPGYGFMVDYTDDPYMERDAFTAKLKTDLVPDIFSAVGVDYSKLETDTVPGGYELALNPSIQTRVPEDWTATTKTAAALGVVMFQYSVLLTDFTPSSEAGTSGYGAVAFPAGALDEKLAGEFFNHAAMTNMALGTGFFAFGDSMYFLNIADDAGMPFSGVADDVFIKALDDAAKSFMGAKAALSASGECDARFVENDWDTKPMGDEYWAQLSDLDQAKQDELKALQTEFKTAFEAAVMQYGWDMAPMPKRVAPPHRGYFGKRFGGFISK